MLDKMCEMLNNQHRFWQDLLEVDMVSIVAESTFLHNLLNRYLILNADGSTGCIIILMRMQYRDDLYTAKYCEHKYRENYM